MRTGKSREFDNACPGVSGENRKKKPAPIAAGDW
jgi:hypothetical protein